MALATDSYASAALLEYHWREPVAVFGRGTSHARQDDIDTDWRALPARTCSSCGASRRCRRTTRRISVSSRSSGSRWAAAATTRSSDAASTTQAYRAGVLADIRDRYYRIPPWLPVGRCYFFERYFPR